MTQKSKKKDIKVDDKVFCPSSGLGLVLAIESREYCGVSIDFFKISFGNNDVILHIPVTEAENMGIRHLSSKVEIEKAMEVLLRVIKFNEPWARRMEILKNELYSGSIILIARVVSILFQDGFQKTSSYTEKSIFEEALNRLVSEVSVVLNITKEEARRRIIDKLNSRKAPVKQKLEHEENSNEFEDLDLDIYDDHDEEETSSREKKGKVA